MAFFCFENRKWQEKGKTVKTGQKRPEKKKCVCVGTQASHGAVTKPKNVEKIFKLKFFQN